MNATIRTAKNARPMGRYVPTTHEEAKAAADFLVVDVQRTHYTIVWKDGRRERVSGEQLTALECTHFWVTDF